MNACHPDFRRLVVGTLFTGCRYGELVSMTARDYNPSAGVVLVPKVKGGKHRYIPLTDEGRRAFTHWTAGKLGADLVFTHEDGSGWGKSHQARRMEEACKIARIEPSVSFHDLRHTYASLLAMNGVSLQVIAEALGHAATRMTERHYAHLRPNYVADTIRANLPTFGHTPENKVTSLHRKP